MSFVGDFLPDPEEYGCSDGSASKSLILLRKWTMLIRKNSNQTIELKKEELNLQDQDGLSPLLIAAKFSRSLGNDIVEILIKAGADLNLSTKNGWSPLMTAVKYSNSTSQESTVKLLIRSGANLNIQNKAGWSALMMAAKYVRNDVPENIIHMLIKAGSNLNLQNKYGLTAIMIAIRCEILSAVKLLLAGGAKISIYGLSDFFENLTAEDIFFFLKNNNVTVDEIMNVPILNNQKFLTLKLFLEVETRKKNWSKVVKNLPTQAKNLREDYRLVPVPVADLNIISFQKVTPIGIRILNLYKEKLVCDDPDIIFLLDGLRNIEQKIQSYCKLYF